MFVKKLPINVESLLKCRVWASSKVAITKFRKKSPEIQVKYIESQKYKWQLKYKKSRLGQRILYIYQQPPVEIVVKALRADMEENK